MNDTTIERSVFGLIREINPDDDSTWKNRIFLTFDIDWACDDVIADAVEIVEQYDVPVTWFITHHTSLLDRIRSNNKFDIGLHPNFNPLLDGESTKANTAERILAALCEIVPGATTVRAHSLVHSERIADLFLDYGLCHVSNVFIPIGRNNRITPWRLWGGLTMVPHCWQDNVALKMDVKFPSVSDATRHLVVYDFHPIHVFLNTENLARYERTRALHREPSKLLYQRYSGEGTRSHLQSLLETDRNLYKHLIVD